MYRPIPPAAPQTCGKQWKTGKGCAAYRLQRLGEIHLSQGIGGKRHLGAKPSHLRRGRVQFPPKGWSSPLWRCGMTSQRGESYFMAEVRLPKTADRCRPEQALALPVYRRDIKGHQHVERLAASQAVLEELHRRDCICVAATHDLKLTQRLAGSYACYHFQETITGEGVIFDYKLRSGPSHTRNAIRLLNMLGFSQATVQPCPRASGKRRKHPMTVKIITLGCKVNQYESQAMLEALLAAGFTQAAPDEAAGVVVVNSCTVTAQSDHKVRQALRRAKKDNPGQLRCSPAACPRPFPDAAAALLEADIVLGTQNVLIWCHASRSFWPQSSGWWTSPPTSPGSLLSPCTVSEFHGRTRAFLKIQDGCDRFCAYCIIPYDPGPGGAPRPWRTSARRWRSWARPGTKKVVLTGINLPAYGKELGLHLCDAVEAACEAPGIQRVRLGSLEPEQLTPGSHCADGKPGQAVPAVPFELAVRLRRHPPPDEPPLHPPPSRGKSLGICERHSQDAPSPRT